MSQAPAPAIMWFRDDLRLADNPALHAAASQDRPLICVYIFEENDDLRPLGGASKVWLHGALSALHAALFQHQGGLTILRGDSAAAIERLIADTGAGAIYWNRRYDAAGRVIDSSLKAKLKERGIIAESFNGSLLHEPWSVKNKSGAPFQVFSAYWRAARGQGEPQAPLASPRKLTFYKLPKKPRDECTGLDDLGLLPKAPDWSTGLRDSWTPSEQAAQDRLAVFLKTGLRGYASGRDRPDKTATSQLSPYLRFGQISPRQIWHAVKDAIVSGTSAAEESDLEKFLSELGWREFSYQLLFEHADLAQRNLRPGFAAMPWRNDPKALRAWQRGQTGYPIVDAGMRQLWTMGWMHNRVRMAAASFLIKHLLIDWRRGEDWFWDTLADADPANNAASWQWVAGCGADAAPYFRIFNPTSQGEKFDPDGAYVKHWVPELAGLPVSVIHKPWKASAQQLSAAGIALGDTYPLPIVDHDMARRRALAAFKEMGEG